MRGVLLLRESSKIVFGRGSAPNPAGELTMLPGPFSRLGRGIPYPIPVPLNAFGRRFGLGAFVFVALA